MKANLKPIKLEKGPYEYPGFLLKEHVFRTFILKSGNIVAQDFTGRLYDVHPYIDSRYNHDKGANEDMEPSYPIRWQIVSYLLPPEREMPQPLKDILPK
jgi:hypothetical protein